MAESKLRARLRRLFSTNVIVRHAGGRKLKIADTNRIQQTTKDNLVDRYSRLYSNLATGGYGKSQQITFQSQRIGLFRDYEEMDNDPIISSALDIYADESTMRSEYGDVLNIQSENENIYDILHNLYYDILNIEFNLWPWVRNLCKYGDFYLYLDIKDKYGVTNVVPLSTYDVTRIEGQDPSEPYLTTFHVQDADNRHSNQRTEKEFQNYEVAHFRLLSDVTYLPYGRSYLEPARKIFKQTNLMEDAMLIHRIMRAPEKRMFYINVGSIPPNEVDQFMQKTINAMKKTPYIGQDGNYNLKFNIQNMMEDFYLPVRGGDTSTRIDTTKGLDYDGTNDVQYLQSKLFAALKIPKAYFGYEGDLQGKATLAAEDIRFARTVERVQKILEWTY